MVSPFISNH